MFALVLTKYGQMVRRQKGGQVGRHVDVAPGKRDAGGKLKTLTCKTREPMRVGLQSLQPRPQQASAEVAPCKHFWGHRHRINRSEHYNTIYVAAPRL